MLRIPDPGLVKNQVSDRYGINIQQPVSYFRELKQKILGFKYLNSRMWIRDKHPGSATLISAKIVVTRNSFSRNDFFTGFGFAMEFIHNKNFAKLILRMTNYYDMMNKRTIFVRHIPQNTVERGNIEQVINYNVKLKILRDVP